MHPIGKNFKATLIESGLHEDKNGNTQPYLKFRTEHGEITWFGSLKSEESTEFAVKQILRAGFIGNDFEDLKLPLEATFLPQPLTVTVENNEYNGKSTPRLTFVNQEKREFTGQAPKKASVFAKFKKELGVKGKLEDAPF